MLPLQMLLVYVRLTVLPDNTEHSLVVGALASVNVVNRHWARLVLGWVIACGRVNHLGMSQVT